MAFRAVRCVLTLLLRCTARCDKNCSTSFADQRTQLVHEAGRVIRQFWWYIQYHAFSLHAVFIYSILRLARRNCTVKNGDIRQLSQNSINFGLRSLQLYEKYRIVSDE
jgi:hypothetical protein